MFTHVPSVNPAVLETTIDHLPNTMYDVRDQTALPAFGDHTPVAGPSQLVPSQDSHGYEVGLLIERDCHGSQQLIKFVRIDHIPRHVE